MKFCLQSARGAGRGIGFLNFSYHQKFSGQPEILLRNFYLLSKLHGPRLVLVETPILQFKAAIKEGTGVCLCYHLSSSTFAS